MIFTPIRKINVIELDIIHKYIKDKALQMQTEFLKDIKPQIITAPHCINDLNHLVHKVTEIKKIVQVVNLC